MALTPSASYCKHSAPLLNPSIALLLAAYCLFLPSCVAASLSVCETPSPVLEHFVDALTTPPTVDVTDGQQITLGAFKISQKLHRDLPATTLYAYGTNQETATYPGPTLKARQGVPAHIRWENHIPDTSHFLGVDNTIPWANPSRGGVPIVTHLHGGEAESASDGHPDAWFTSYNETGLAYVKQNYTYANAQPPATLWYHDHTVGITRLNLMAGLSGFYILNGRSDEEQPVGILLLIRDWRFFPNGSINFPIDIASESASPTKWCAEYGDTMVVNGKVWPYLRVFPGQYRFRLLNGCNARFLELTLSNLTFSFLQIGTDGGFLPEATRGTCLLVSPAERVDVLIDFSGLKNGSEVILINTAPAPFPDGKLSYSTNGTFYVMKFVVVTKRGATEGLLDADSHIKLPSTQPPTEPPPDDLYPPVDLVRSLTLQSFRGTDGKPNHLTLGNHTWSDPVDLIPSVGSTEIWELINLGEDAHNMHIHLLQFQVLNQQSFDAVGYENGSCSCVLQYPKSGSCFTEYPRGPEVHQQGWKDTVIAWPGNVTRLLLRFSSRDGSPYPFDPSTGPGYAWHCHTLDHEDYEMMRPFVLRFPNETSKSAF